MNVSKDSCVECLVPTIGHYYSGRTFLRQDLDKGSQITEAYPWGRNWDSRSFLSISSQLSWDAQVSSYHQGLYCSGPKQEDQLAVDWNHKPTKPFLLPLCLSYFVRVTENWPAKRDRLKFWLLSHNCIPETACCLWSMVSPSLPKEIGRKIIITQVFWK